VRKVVIGIAIGIQRTASLVCIDQQARKVFQVVDLGGGSRPLVVNVVVRKVPIIKGLFGDGGVVRAGRCSAAKDYPCTCEYAKACEVKLHKISFYTVKNSATGQKALMEKLCVEIA